MALVTERLRYYVDFITGDAERNLKKVGDTAQDEVGADGKAGKAVSKLEQLTGVSFEKMKANAAGWAIGAATAVSAYAGKAIYEFQQTAIAADDFARAMDVPIEQASRWLSVAQDFGINNADLQDAFRTVGELANEGSDVFEQLGIEVSRARDGTVDLATTTEDVIEALRDVEDPAKKATLAIEILGSDGARTFQSLIESGEDLQTLFAEVEDHDVIDREEAKKAREFKDAIDDLRDAEQKLSRALGEALIPTLTDAAEAANDFGDAIESVIPSSGEGGSIFGKALTVTTKGLAGLTESFVETGRAAQEARAELIQDWFSDDLLQRTEGFTEGLDGVRGALVDELESQVNAETARKRGAGQAERYAEMLNRLGEAAADQAYEQELASQAAERAAEVTDRLREAARDLRDEIDRNNDTTFDYEKALMRLEGQSADYAEQVGVVTEMQAAGQEGTEEYDEAVRNLRSSEIDGAEAALETARAYAEKMGAEEGSYESAVLQREELLRLAEQFPYLRDEIALYIAELDRIPRSVSTTLTIGKRTISLGGGGGNAGGAAYRGVRAAGGPVSPGGFYEVNENGSELFHEGGKTYLMTGKGGRVEPAGAAVGGGGSNVYHITIEGFANESSIQQLTDALDEIERRRMGAL